MSGFNFVTRLHAHSSEQKAPYCVKFVSHFDWFLPRDHAFLFYSSLWKRAIAWERSRTASAYGIIWGDAGQNKQGEI